jgi:hypothetical protein
MLIQSTDVIFESSQTLLGAAIFITLPRRKKKTLLRHWLAYELARVSLDALYFDFAAGNRA